MKKNFSKSHSFFTDNEPQTLTEHKTTRKAPIGYKPAYIEVKSKRVQLVFQPSIYNKAKIRAAEKGLSLNEYIHRLIDADTK